MSIRQLLEVVPEGVDEAQCRQWARRLWFGVDVAVSLAWFEDRVLLHARAFPSGRSGKKVFRDTHLCSPLFTQKLERECVSLFLAMDGAKQIDRLNQMEPISRKKQASSRMEGFSQS